jgi:DNA-binding beta-propeller fold protein YncE
MTTMLLRAFAPVILVLAATAATAQVQTIAGNGKPGHAGDGGPAIAGQLNNPYGLTIGPDGALYICEIDNHVIRRLDLKTHTLSTVAGNGQKGYSGDGGPALGASLNQPYEIRFDSAGNMYFAEMPNHVVRRVDAKTKIISTLAGTGEPGFSGDGGPAVKAQLRQPHSIAIDPAGESLYIADIGNHRIRRVNLKSGQIDTFAGTGERKPAPDGAALEGAPLNGPRAMAFDSRGDMYLVLREGNAVYRIDMRARTIHHIAGTGVTGYAGDGGPAVQAQLSGPKGIAIAPDGRVFINDTESHTVRRIDPQTGVIDTVIGNGTRGDGPDGAPRSCLLARPHGIFIDRAGVIYVADSENHRIRVLKE